MTRLRLLSVSAVLMLAGCVDNASSISREYRNLNNEAVDALMMITNRSQARIMTSRVLKPMKDRYEAVDKKLEKLFGNCTKKEFVTDIYGSDGVHLYITELAVNRQRFALEMTRLRVLLKQYVDDSREKFDDPTIGPQDAAPEIADLVLNKTILDPVRQQLQKPKLIEYIGQFSSWKLDGYPAMFEKFQARREVFAPKRDIILVERP